MARRDPIGIRLLTRRGNDWSERFPRVVEAVNLLKVRFCLIDGEVVCCDERGLARFDVLRRRRNEAVAFLYAFDLLELNGQDLRRELGFDLSFWAFTRLAEIQEPGSTGGEAGGGGGVGTMMNTDSTTIRQIEFELEKAEHGMALPYDAERVGQLRKMLVEARKQKLSARLAARRRRDRREAEEGWGKRR